MFGKNPVMSQTLVQDGRLNVVGVFYTIQGEGPYAGMPCVFVRLAGCNLRCTWCDTDFESRDKVLEVHELVNEVMYKMPDHSKLCVITGGEPLLQNLVPFIREMNRRNVRVQIETAGTVWLPFLETVSTAIVCSPKIGKVHQAIRDNCRHFKYVVGVGDEITETGRIVTATQPGTKPKELAWADDGDTIWIQPRDDHDEEKNAANLAFARDLCLKFGYRMGVQLHKLINVE